MLNRRAILLGILCITFVAAAFGQDQSDPNVITVPEKIDLGKLNTTVEKLNTTVGELSETVGELSKTVGELEKTVTRLDERTKRISNLQFVILAAILGGPVVTILFYRRKDSEGANTVDRFTEQITKLTSAQAEQIAKLTSAQAQAQAETSAQISKLISAQAAISATRGVTGDPKAPSEEGLEELTDDIRSQQRDTEERV